MSGRVSSFAAGRQVGEDGEKCERVRRGTREQELPHGRRRGPSFRPLGRLCAAGLLARRGAGPLARQLLAERGEIQVELLRDRVLED